MAGKKDLPADTPASPSLPARLKAKMRELVAAIRTSRRATIATACVVAAVLIGAAAFLDKARRAVAKLEKPTAEQRITAAEALAALDEGYDVEARRLARKLKKQQNLKAEEIAVPDFILGAVAVHEAATLWKEERKAMFAEALAHLEQARKKGGFPPGRGAQGRLLLGMSLYHVGRIDECRAPLERGLPAAGKEAPRVHRLLASAYERGSKPNLPRALEHLAAYLVILEVPEPDRNKARMRRALVLLRLGRTAECLKTLDQIPPTDTIFPETAVVRGRIVMNEAMALQKMWEKQPTAPARAAVEKTYAKAIEVLRHGLIDPLATRAVRQSMYLTGRCLRGKGDIAAALAQFTKTRSLYLETHEGTAAALEEGELLRAAGHDEEAVAAYKRGLESVETRGAYANPWITADDYRDRVISAYRHYLTQAHFDRAIAIAHAIGGLSTPARAAELEAEATTAKAGRILADADSLPVDKADEARNQGRRLMRESGRKYREVAQLEFSSRQYPEDVWHAGQCLLAGQDFTGALAAFEEHQKYEVRHRPAALSYMGEALLSLARYDESLALLKECVEIYPRDAASFRARILAAQAYSEKGDVASAEKLLLENLNGDSLTPESKEWRESLFLLGKLMFHSGRYDQAIARLDEAVERYPAQHDAIEGRYLIAEAYRLSAKVPQEKLQAATIEAARLAYFRQVQENLESAVSYYEKVQKVLNRAEYRLQQTSLEKAMLRNSYFAVGAALFDLGRYDDAIRAYGTAISRYQHDPEVLDAFLQIASCYRRLNKVVEARGTFQQAKVVLGRIPASAPFTSTTNYTREEWTRVLDWLIKL